MWKFLDQGSNLCHGIDPSCYRDNARCLTRCTARELWYWDLDAKDREGKLWYKRTLALISAFDFARCVFLVHRWRETSRGHVGEGEWVFAANQISRSQAVLTVWQWLKTTTWISFSEHIDERRICNAVSPDKDVDGFHVINVGRMCLDQNSMLPATPWGVWEIIKRTGRYIP